MATLREQKIKIFTGARAFISRIDTPFFVKKDVFHEKKNYRGRKPINMS